MTYLIVKVFLLLNAALAQPAMVSCILILCDKSLEYFTLCLEITHC